MLAKSWRCGLRGTQWGNAFAAEYEKTICTFLEDTLDPKQVKRANVEDVKLCLLPPVGILWLSPPFGRFSCNSKPVGGRQMFAALPYMWHHQPCIVLMEQVEVSTWEKHRQVLNEMKQELLSAGCKLKGSVLNCMGCDVPQHRERYILVAILKPRRQSNGPARSSWA